MREPHPSSDLRLKRRCELLRLCCVLCGADADAARRLVAERAEPIDWPALVEIAREFRLGMLLHRVVQPKLADLVPGAALAALQRMRADNEARSAALCAELQRLMDRLGAAGIPAIAYKGPVFGVKLYGDAAARISSDLDLLVCEPDVPRAMQLMVDDGYRAGPVEGWEMSFEREPGSSVDLHWSISEGIHQFPLTADELWARRTSVTLGDGAPIAALGEEDTLLTICFNGVTEDWQRLDRIADVAALLRSQPAIDWPGFLDRCRRRGCERLVLLGLHLARELFGARLSEVVEWRLRPHRRSIAAMGYEVDAYLPFAIASTDRRRGWDSWRFLLRLRERPRERLAYYQAIAYSLFRPHDDDAPWLRRTRLVLFAVLRLPLLCVKRGLIVAGHRHLK